MASETEERTERAAPPRFSESESPPAWLIATRGDLREMEARVNYRIDDAKTDIRTRIDDRTNSTNTRIDDAKAETSARIDELKAETSARIDELKAEGAARDAKLDAHTETLARIESKLDSENRRKHLAAVWIGIAVAAAGIAAGVLWNLVG